MRPGNVHSADGWRSLPEPIVERYGGAGRKRYFRADAAFASPRVYEYLEGQSILYALRMPANGILYEGVGIYLYHDFRYRVGFRGIAKVEWHRGDLIPRAGFIVTSLSRSLFVIIARCLILNSESL